MRYLIPNTRSTSYLSMARCKLKRFLAEISVRIDRITDFSNTLVNTTWFPVLTLFLLAIQVQWGLWNSLDIAREDEAIALINGYKLLHGIPVETSWWGAAWWNSPFYPLLYTLTISVFRSLATSFYAQRIILTFLSILVMYFLLVRLTSKKVAWFGAAWLAVSWYLVDLQLDRTDFLAAAIFAWIALWLADLRSKKRMILAVSFAFLSCLFRIENILLFITFILLWISHELFQSLHGSTIKKLSIIFTGNIVVAILGVFTIFTIFRNFASVDQYFVWVFANNRAITLDDSAIASPMWQLFTSDYGADRSIFSILRNPGKFTNDVAVNGETMLTLFKRMSTDTTWATIGLRAERWFLGMIFLFTTGIILVMRDWESKWKTFFEKRHFFWLPLVCLLPMILFYLVIRPIAIYLFIFSPLIIAPLCFIGYVLFSTIVTHHKNQIFVFLIMVIIIAAPSPRAFQGDQPIRNAISYFIDQSSPEKAIKLLGSQSLTICLYLDINGQVCKYNLWNNDERVIRLDEIMLSDQYDYLIYTGVYAEFNSTRHWDGPSFSGQ